MVVACKWKSAEGESGDLPRKASRRLETEPAGNEPAKPMCATFATKRAIGAIRRAVKCPKGKGRGVESGECFACGQVGHIARHCPKSSQK